MKDLFKFYWDLTVLAIDENGVFPHNAIVINQEGTTELMALMVDSKDALKAIANVIRKNPKELIFGMDRTCREGQGTTLKDCVAGCHLKDGKFTPFIIEYQHNPRIVKPMDYENQFWIETLKKEIEMLKRF